MHQISSYFRILGHFWQSYKYLFAENSKNTLQKSCIWCNNFDKAVIRKMFGSCLPPAPKIFFKLSVIFGAEGQGFFKFPVMNLFNKFWKCMCYIFFYKSMMIPLEWLIKWGKCEILTSILSLLPNTFQGFWSKEVAWSCNHETYINRIWLFVIFGWRIRNKHF